MSRTDLIADALTMIRNASLVKKEDVTIPFSKILLSICEILKKEEYVENYRQITEDKKSYIKVYLRYIGKNPAIKHLRKISTPGRRVYSTKGRLPNVLRGRGVAVVTTSKGVMTSKDAREKSIGGEVLFYIW